MDRGGVTEELLKAAGRMRRVRLSVLFPDISQGEFLALEVIYRYTLIQDGRKICVSDLAKNMKIASSAVSRMLHTLEERGLISREVASL